MLSQRGQFSPFHLVQWSLARWKECDLQSFSIRDVSSPSSLESPCIKEVSQSDCYLGSLCFRMWSCLYQHPIYEIAINCYACTNCIMVIPFSQ